MALQNCSELNGAGRDLDACLMRQLEKLVSRIDTEHSNLTRDILSLEQKDHDLLSLTSTLTKTLFNLSVQIERLLSYCGKVVF